jgi:hypothetical protein
MLKIIKSSEPIRVDRLNLCIYSQPGLGKTSLAYSAEAPLLLDFDRGAHRAANRKDTVPVTNWAEIAELSPEDLAPYKTVIVDTAGRALDFLTQDIIRDNPKAGRAGALTLQGYGTLKARFASWLKALNTFGKDVVLIAHMDEQKNGDDVIERLDVQGGSKGEIYKSVDAMGRIFVRDKKRVLDFSPRENAFGKNPSNLDVLTIPEPHTEEGRVFLGTVIAAIKASMNTLSDEQMEMQRLMEEWGEAIGGFSTVEEFNQQLELVKKLPKAVQALFGHKAKDLGFIFNKTSKLYEAVQSVAS